MASWTEQDINSLLPGEPLNSAKVIASFENPVAIAEGAPGAPRMTRRVQRITTGQNVGTLGYVGARFDYVATGGAPGQPTIDFSNDGGATWPASFVLAPDGTNTQGVVYVNFATGAYISLGASGTLASFPTGGTTRVRVSTPGGSVANVIAVSDGGPSAV